MVMEALGRLPSPGDTVAIGGYEFEVEQVADRVVDSVIVAAIDQPEQKEPE
jgi:Mg2+/Co2+ transporter CorC